MKGYRRTYFAEWAVAIIDMGVILLSMLLFTALTSLIISVWRGAEFFELVIGIALAIQLLFPFLLSITLFLSLITKLFTKKSIFIDNEELIYKTSIKFKGKKTVRTSTFKIGEIDQIHLYTGYPSRGFFEDPMKIKFSNREIKNPPLGLLFGLKKTNPNIKVKVKWGGLSLWLSLAIGAFIGVIVPFIALFD